MSNEKNLKPFPKGVSGNPSGRPHWKAVTEAMRKELDADKLSAMCLVIYGEAMKGNISAATFIADRLEGKPQQRIEVSTNDEPIRVFNIEGLDDYEKAEPLPILESKKVSSR